MGKKVERPAKPAPAAKAGADDLQVLNPNRELEIEGRKITVREYGFVEGLGLRPLMQPFLDDLYVIMKGAGVPELEAVIGVLGKHNDMVVTLMATSANVDESWIRSLPQRPGKLLLYVWWIVNGPFFVGEVTDRLQQERFVAQLKAPAGQTSMPASSPVDMEPQPPSV
ncbi:DUF6631 family protein [Pseudomonas nitroreducens]|uniref:DUF6631 family protein n=1 Tax=Pseudomonas nitroreducens TaxID=46680 RepID=UPI002D7EDD02|nr:DUF6631 family protein [Pseudomonas nitroreducens]